MSYTLEKFHTRPTNGLRWTTALHQHCTTQLDTCTQLDTATQPDTARHSQLDTAENTSTFILTKFLTSSTDRGTAWIWHTHSLDEVAIKTNKFTAWIRHTHSLEQAHHSPSLHLVNCLPFFLPPSDSLPESAWKNASR
jgi:hypothetical protein